MVVSAYQPDRMNSWLCDPGWANGIVQLDYGDLIDNGEFSLDSSRS